MEFSLAERYKVVQPEPAPADNRGAYRVTQELRPTGQLVLRLHEYLEPRARITWRDTPTKPLEDKLNHVIAGLLTAAAMLRERRLRCEEEERRRQAAQMERLKQEEARRREEERLTNLVQQVAAWRQAAPSNRDPW